MATTEKTEKADGRQQLITRLKRAEGQLRGVQRMLDEGAECRSVLTQLAAAKAAIDQVGLLLMTEQLRTCIAEGGESCEADFDAAMDTLLRHVTLAH